MNTVLVVGDLKTEELSVYRQWKHVTHRTLKQGRLWWSHEWQCKRRIVCVCVKRSCDAEQWILFIWSCGVSVCAFVILYATV